MKKLVSLFCILSMLFGVLCVGGVSFASAETEGDFEYEVYDGEAFITKYNGSATTLTIPSILGGYPVTTVTGFRECTTLQSVTIPNSVTTISLSAFSGCTSLQSVTIPNSVQDINEWAFSDCTSLQNIELPNGIYSIQKGVFSGCTSLQNVTVPDSVNSIFRYAFEDCTSLKSVTFSNNLTYIGESAFNGCSALQSVSLPSSLTSIDNYAFANCTALRAAAIPDGTYKILYGAFSGCTALETVHISDSVEIIGECVFEGCAALKSITMENGVKRIGSDAFSDTAYYKNEANWTDGVLYIGNHLIKAKDTFSGDYTVRDGTTMIASSAFNGCAALSGVSLPDSVFWIGEYAFTNTAFYEDESNWDNGALYIGDHLICVKSTDDGLLVVRDGTKTIAPWVESGCDVKTIVIPKSVELIGYEAFSSWQPTIYYGGSEEEWSAFTRETGVLLWYKGPDTGVVEGNYIFFSTAIKHFNYITHTVSYNANGGEGAPAAQTKIPGTPLTLSATVPTREGYTFLGWATSANATNAVYQPGDAFKNNVDTTLYAVWEADVIDEPILGDLSGDSAVDMRDAFALYVSVSGGAPLTDVQKLAADMNGDGLFDMRDAFALYKIASGG